MAETIPSIFELPLRLAPDERRDLARRLGERLGTQRAGSLAILCDPIDVRGAPGVLARFKIEGNAADVKVRGLQQVAYADQVFEQRDAIGVGGLAEKVALLIAVDERIATATGEPGAPPPPAEHPAARLPAVVRIEVREGTEAGLARACEEAFRVVGERAAPLIAKGEVAILELPGGVPAAEAKAWLRGRWTPPPEGAGAAAAAALGRLALVEDPRRSERRLLVREALAIAPGKAEAFERAWKAGDDLAARLATQRAIAPLAIIPAAAHVNLRVFERKIDRRALEKAIAALAWEAAGEAPADPRPLPKKVAFLAPDAQTAALYLGGARRLEGDVREMAPGTGPRMAAVDLGVFDAKGERQGTILERHLAGLPEGGIALAAAFERVATLAIAGPKKTAEKWLDRFVRAL